MLWEAWVCFIGVTSDWDIPEDQLATQVSYHLADDCKEAEHPVAHSFACPSLLLEMRRLARIENVEISVRAFSGRTLDATQK